VQFLEVGVHGRGVQHEQPGRLIAPVAEGMTRSARHQQEIPRAAGQFGAVK
jgi:hypothetical protein